MIRKQINWVQRQSDVGQNVLDEPSVNLGALSSVGSSQTYPAWTLFLSVKQGAGNLTFQDTFPF